MAHPSVSSIIQPSSHPRPRFRRNFLIAIICALPLEYDAAVLLIDEFWDLNGNQYGRADGDRNTYRNGRIGAHNVVLMLLPAMGTAAVAGSAASLRTSYPALQIAFLVGICGGSPGIQAAFLGDVVISDGVVQYLLGRQYPEGFVMKGISEGNVHAPNKEIRGLIAYFKTEAGRKELEDGSAHHLKVLQDESVLKNYNSSYEYPGLAEDKLFKSTYPHKHRGFPSCNICSGETDLCDEATQHSCSELGCDESHLVRRTQFKSTQRQRLEQAKARGPEILIGRVASGDTVMKSGEHRDRIAKRHNIIAFEMEGAGLWDEIPTVVIKGITDYSDSHKNKIWQPYAAATAAAVAKAVMERYIPNDNIESMMVPAGRSRETVSTPKPTSSTNIQIENASARDRKDTDSRAVSSAPLQTLTSSQKPKMKQTDTWWTLENAILNFQMGLDELQRRELQNIKTVPDSDAVLIFTAHLDSRNRNRKGSSVASRLFSVLQSARDFSDVVDSFGSARSNLSFLVWGSIKMTILLAFESITYYEALSEIFMKIGRLCPVFQDYYRVYPTSATLQKSLCNFFTSLIACCRQVVDIVKRKDLRYFFEGSQSFVLRGITPQVNEIQRCSVLFRQELMTALTAVEQPHVKGPGEEPSEGRSSKDLFKWASGKAEAARKLQVQAEEARIAKRRRKEETQELLESLSAHDFLTPLKQSRRKRQNGTGEWLFETSEFVDWIHGNGAPVFWCSGKIGSGKTILSAGVIDRILTEKRGSDTFMSFFFVQFDIHQSLQAATVLKSIIRQALSQSDVSDQQKALLEHIQSELEPGPEDLTTILLTIVARCKRFYIVIDGLDECESMDRDEVLKALRSLLDGTQKVSIFLASRESISDQIKRTFAHQFHHISTAAPSAESEIATYVDAAIEDKLRREDLNVGDLNLINEIKIALTNGADGMFLWVAFQIEELCSRHCDDEIRKAIRDLPKDLTETFNRALRRIASSQHADIAQRCFRWVAAAQRPLTRDELREAISIEIGQLHSIEERLTNGIHLISSWCENLLVCDEEKYIVQFAHHSVQEFLTTEQSCHDPHPELDTFHFKLQDADHFIGEICVSYLNFDDLKTSLARPPQTQRPHHSKRSLPRVLPSDIAWNTLGNVWSSKVPMHALRRFMSGSEVQHSMLDVVGNLANFNEDLTPPTGTSQPEHPFLEYASMHWLHHTKEFQKGVSKTWNLWQKMARYGHNLAQFPWAPTSLEHHFQHRQSNDYASDTYIEDLLDSHPEGEEYHPLRWAFNNRHRAILWLIFHADPSLPINMYYRLTVSLIERSIWEQDVQLLDVILSGSNKLQHLLDLPVYASNNALQAAASAGYLEVTEMLLAAGVNVDATTPINGAKTALRLAAEAGHLAVTARLIEAGADLNLHLGSGYNGLTALHLAATKGHFWIVELLLTAGANVHSLTFGDEILTALHLAAKSGHLEIITRLLKAGLDVNNNVRPRGRGLTPLHVATKAGHLKAVELLLDMGANVNIYLPQQANANVHLPLHEHKNALHLAAEADHFEIVRLFLEKGSDPNGYISPLDEGLTPMHLAARRGHSGIVQRLLEGGARVDSRLSPADGNHTALYIAAEEGHISTMLVLLAAGADVDAPSTVNGYRTALFTAALYGKSAEVVRFLIKAGANVNATLGSDEGGWTILDLCSEQGEIYDMLVAAGAVASIDARAAAVWRQDNITSNEKW